MAVAARKLDSEYVYAGTSTMRVYTHRTAPAQQRTAPEVMPQAEPAQGLMKKLIATCAVLAAAAAILLVLVQYAVIAEQYALVNEYKETIEANERTLKELEVRLNTAVSLDEAREAALAAGLGYPSASQIVKIDGKTGAGSVSSAR